MITLVANIVAMMAMDVIIVHCVDGWFVFCVLLLLFRFMVIVWVLCVYVRVMV
jgi:hypothetical protein